MTTDRARQVIRHLGELKIQLGDDTRGATSAEHEALQDAMASLARVSGLLEGAPDDATVLRIEVEQARSMAMDQRDLLQRRHLNLASPPWRAPASRDPNLIFYNGPDAGRQVLADLARRLKLELNAESYHSADAAAARWSDLRAAGAAIFDLTGLDPQVHYDLGVALALGTGMVLVAEQSTVIPFDVGQDVMAYPPTRVGDALAAALEDTLYGVAPATDPRSSVEASIDYGRFLAKEHGTELALAVLSDLEDEPLDPIEAHSLLRLLDPYVPELNLVVLRSRWPASFPAEERRCFVVMPFHQDLDPTFTAIQQAGCRTEIEVVRGDNAKGQEILGSIWAEIGKATEVVVDVTGFNPNVCIELGMADTLGRSVLLIATAGTEAVLADRLPSMASRRCHPYSSADDLAPVLARFFAGELQWD